MADQLPVFDDEWIAKARHHELSTQEMERNRRSQRRAIRRRRSMRFLVRLGAVLAVVGIGVYIARTPDRENTSIGFDQVGDAHNLWAYQAHGDRPTLSDGESARLLPEVAGADSASGYAFAAVREDGSPVTYDPCRRVEFVVNPAGAPQGYLEILRDALAEASHASGLVLTLTDFTDEPPTTDRRQFQRERYGDRWAPVLVAWTDEAEIPELAEDTAGLGGSAWIEYGSDRAWYVSGLLYLDRELGDDPMANRLVILHELGHVLGLNHVDDPTQIMHSEGTADGLGSGDLAGLARVGAGECAGAL